MANRFQLRVDIGVLALFLTTALTVAGCATTTGGAGTSGAAPSAEASSSAILAQARSLIRAQALVVPSDATLAEATSVPTLVKALGDPFARYFDSKGFAMMMEESQGSYGGIGLRLADDARGRAYVVSVVSGSPAEKAGIQRADAIVGVNGIVRDTWTAAEVPAYIRGPVGSSVRLVLVRPGSTVPLTLTLTRQQIASSDVTSELVGGVGVIRVSALDDTTGDQVRSAIRALTAKGAKAWVLDLRDNPGGPIQAAVDTASLFLEDGEVVSAVARDGAQSYSVSGQTATGDPLVVLVNGYTDSGAEVVEAALQARHRATIVGAKTPGDGSVQTVEKLADGSGITFTTAHLVAPGGRSIAGVGVAPDVAVAMAGPSTGSSTDVQLQRAIKKAAALAAQ